MPDYETSVENFILKTNKAECLASYKSEVKYSIGDKEETNLFLMTEEELRENGYIDNEVKIKQNEDVDNFFD